MKTITVSSDNYRVLSDAEPGEEIKIGHVNCHRRCSEMVLVTKVANISSTVEMTIEQIEEALGHKIKIVG